jgi:amino acid transporter
MAHSDSLDDRLVQALANAEKTISEPSPTSRQKIGYFTIACLILNRMVGSGIFVTPRLVLLGTGSVGISLILWVLGGVISFCGLVVWNEFGLTIPQRVVPSGSRRPVPRSGGEKNYLEYLLERPRFLATCLYGIPFLILGNLSGNAVVFGTYVLQAADIENAPRSWNIGIAIAAVTASCLIHMFSRRGGIYLSNFLAVIKVAVLLAIVVVGLAVGGGAKIGKGVSQGSSLSPQKAFADPQPGISSYTYSLFYVLYTYSGFEQPFYVCIRLETPISPLIRS